MEKTVERKELNFGDGEKGQSFFESLFFKTDRRFITISKSCGSCTKVRHHRERDGSGFNVEIEFTPLTRGNHSKMVQIEDKHNRLIVTLKAKIK